MSVNAWTPATTNQPKLADLKKFTQIGADNAALKDIASQLAQSDIESKTFYMRCGQDGWNELLDQLNAGELLALIKFFTLAEIQLPGWEAGELSPVIWINKYLRSKNQTLDKEMLLWIRENSTNRFIPNGPL